MKYIYHKETIENGKYIKCYRTYTDKVGNKQTQFICLCDSKYSNFNMWLSDTFGYGSGYVLIRVNGKTTPLHRYVVENELNTKLTKVDIIHHKNRDKRDNRFENLEKVVSDKHGDIHKQIYKGRELERLVDKALYK